MKSFDDLKEQWQGQHAPEMEISLKKLASEIKNRQKKLIASNLFVSVAFAAVFMVMGWIWSSFPDRSQVFYISLILMGILLIAVLGGLWAGVHFKNPDTTSETRIFIQNIRKKVRIQLFMLKNGLPVYFILLYTFFCLYLFDLFKDAELIYIVGIYTALTMFFGLMYLFTSKKRIRNIASAQKVLDELNEIDRQLG